MVAHPHHPGTLYHPGTLPLLNSFNMRRASKNSVGPEGECGETVRSEPAVPTPPTPRRRAPNGKFVARPREGRSVTPSADSSRAAADRPRSPPPQQGKAAAKTGSRTPTRRPLEEESSSTTASTGGQPTCFSLSSPAASSGKNTHRNMDEFLELRCRLRQSYISTSARSEKRSKMNTPRQIVSLLFSKRGVLTKQVKKDVQLSSF